MSRCPWGYECHTRWRAGLPAQGAVFASIELWRLRRRGRLAALAYVAVVLCFLAGASLRSGELPVAYAVVVGLTALILMLPAATRFTST